MKKILIIFLLALAGAVQGATYYVAKNGNDANAGSRTSPWLTITKAENTIVAGDTAFVMEGVYNEKLNCNDHSGSAGSPIVFMAYPGNEVIIDGTGLDCSGSYLTRTWQDYVDIIGFIIRNVGMSGTLDGSGMAVIGAHCNIKNCTFYSIYGSGITITGDYTTIENCVLHDLNMGNYLEKLESWGGGITFNEADYGVVKNCTVYNCWGEGLSFIKSNYGNFENNKVYNISSVMVYLNNAQSDTVQRNLIYYTNDWIGGRSNGIGLDDESATPAGQNNIIINNIIFGAKKNISISHKTGCVIANNTLVDAHTTTGLEVDPNYDYASLTVKNNIIVQNNSKPCVTFTPDAQVVFSHNLYNKAYDADAIGTGDKVVNPLFVEYGDTLTTIDPLYFEPVAFSPAINAGTTETLVKEDYFGNARGSVIDMGAIEISDDWLLEYGNLRMMMKAINQTYRMLKKK